MASNLCGKYDVNASRSKLARSGKGNSEPEFSQEACFHVFSCTSLDHTQRTRRQGIAALGNK